MPIEVHLGINRVVIVVLDFALDTTCGLSCIISERVVSEVILLGCHVGNYEEQGLVGWQTWIIIV